MEQDELQNLVLYDPNNGYFYSKSTGVRLGKLDARGYRIIRLLNKAFLEHRLAWLYMYGKIPESMLDHINGVKTDNRIYNLRLATNAENQYNAKLRADNTSGVKGVIWFKPTSSWKVQVKYKGKYVSGQYHKKLEDAIVKVKQLRETLHKEFAKA